MCHCSLCVSGHLLASQGGFLIHSPPPSSDLWVSFRSLVVSGREPETIRMNQLVGKTVFAVEYMLNKNVLSSPNCEKIKIIYIFFKHIYYFVVFLTVICIFKYLK